MDDARTPLDADTLQGWKEIAAHLGKSVRSAQRWEARLGLPVRRITTPDGGQIVHASRLEIDAWRRRQGEQPGEVDDADLDDGGESGDAVDPSPNAPAALVPAEPVDDVVVGGQPVDGRPATSDSATHGRRRSVGYAAMLALGVILGTSLTLALIPVVVTASQFEVDGREIRALHRDGRVAWTHVLEQPAVPPANMDQSQPEQGDIDGDGAFEVAIAASYTTPNWLPERVSDEVLLFTRTGRLRWRVAPADSLHFVLQGLPVRGPWLLHDAAFAVIPPAPPAAAPTPSSGTPGRLWLAYSDVNMRLGFVLEVGPDGRQMLRYVQDGPVKSLVHWRTASGNFLAVGGIDAVSRRASTAIVDLDAAPARWPLDGRISCTGCPGSAPRAVTLMPRSEVGLARLRAAPVIFRLIAANGTLRMDDDDGARSGALAWIDADMKVTRFMHSGRYWDAHRLLEQEGRVKHSILACPERHQPAQVRVWTAGGWTEQLVEPAPPAS